MLFVPDSELRWAAWLSAVGLVALAWPIAQGMYFLAARLRRYDLAAIVAGFLGVLVYFVYLPGQGPIDACCAVHICWSLGVGYLYPLMLTYLGGKLWLYERASGRNRRSAARLVALVSAPGLCLCLVVWYLIPWLDLPW